MAQVHIQREIVCYQRAVRGCVIEGVLINLVQGGVFDGPGSSLCAVRSLERCHLQQWQGIDRMCVSGSILIGGQEQWWYCIERVRWEASRDATCSSGSGRVLMESMCQQWWYYIEGGCGERPREMPPAVVVVVLMEKGYQWQGIDRVPEKMCQVC